MREPRVRHEASSQAERAFIASCAGMIELVNGMVPSGGIDVFFGAQDEAAPAVAVSLDGSHGRRLAGFRVIRSGRAVSSRRRRPFR